MLKHEKKKPHPVLRRSSNLRNKKQVDQPTVEELNYFSVVISTLVSSSTFARSNLKSGHFDYIFIDEISFATEVEALVPIIGLGTSVETITASIVLFGDHKQLSPVLSSKHHAGSLGLGVSLMERMMSCEKFKKNPTFDDRYAVQLLDNYRSHPAILKFCNEHFYEGALRAKMPISVQRLSEVWTFLPNKLFPIIFHAVGTPSKYHGTSSFNYGEIDILVDYVEELLETEFDSKLLTQNDIGVITPYLAQLARLKKALQPWPDIEMGTAEYFQGREKRVILISTVKSGGGIGFLRNERVKSFRLHSSDSCNFLFLLALQCHADTCKVARNSYRQPEHFEEGSVLERFHRVLQGKPSDHRRRLLKLNMIIEVKVLRENRNLLFACLCKSKQILNFASNRIDENGFHSNFHL